MALDQELGKNIWVHNFKLADGLSPRPRTSGSRWKFYIMSFSVCIFFVEKVFTFQFLNDKSHKYVFLTFMHETSQLRSSTCRKNTLPSKISSVNVKKNPDNCEFYHSKIQKKKLSNVTQNSEFSSWARSFGP